MKETSSENTTCIYKTNSTIQEIRKIRKKCKIQCISEVCRYLSCITPCSQVLNPDSLLLGELCAYQHCLALKLAQPSKVIIHKQESYRDLKQHKHYVTAAEATAHPSKHISLHHMGGRVQYPETMAIQCVVADSPFETGSGRMVLHPNQHSSFIANVILVRHSD